MNHASGTGKYSVTWVPETHDGRLRAAAPAVAGAAPATAAISSPAASAGRMRCSETGMTRAEASELRARALQRILRRRAIRRPTSGKIAVERIAAPTRPAEVELRMCPSSTAMVVIATTSGSWVEARKPSAARSRSPSSAR